jgi:hypothetical protein
MFVCVCYIKSKDSVHFQFLLAKKARNRILKYELKVDAMNKIPNRSFKTNYLFFFQYKGNENDQVKEDGNAYRILLGKNRR